MPTATKKKSAPAPAEEPKKATEPVEPEEAESADDETPEEPEEVEEPEGDDDDADDDDAADDEADDEDEEPVAKKKKKEKVLTLTDTQLNTIIEQRIKKELRKTTAAVKAKDAQLTELQAQVDQYRTAEVARLKETFEALPEEVRALAPVKFEAAAKNAKTFARLNKWIPTAQQLAVKLAGGDKKSTAPVAPAKKPAGNLPDPPPASSTPAAGGSKELPTHPLWRSL